MLTLNTLFDFSLVGIVRMEQKNETLLLEGVYDDGPYEVGDENEKNPDLVPAPASSYLGKPLLALYIYMPL